MVGIISPASMDPHKYDIFSFTMFSPPFPHITECLYNKVLHMRLNHQVTPNLVQNIFIEVQVVRVLPFNNKYAFFVT